MRSIDRASLTFALSVVVGICCAYGALSTISDAYAQELPQELSEETVRQTLIDAVHNVDKVTSGFDKEYLSALADRYPVYGVGISFKLEISEEQGQDVVYAPRIVSVLRDSPAQTCGLWKGDWIVSVAGQAVGEMSGTESAAFLDGVRDRILGAQDPFTIEVKRDGELLEIELSKALVGQDIHDFVVERSPGYLKHMDGLRIWLMSLMNRINGADMHDALAMLHEVNALLNEANRPYLELNEYIQSRSVSEPEP
jgi:hypothetical protein